MREFKFRAWDNINKQMLSHRQINVLLKNININRNGEKQWFYMQYTGIKDKNGKEIYEEDFIGNESGRICQVYWNDNIGAWDTCVILSIGNSLGFLNTKWTKCVKVIGNYFESFEIRNKIR